MDPYYTDDHVTIYHGDCLDILDGIEADVLVTDPPYGIGLQTDYAGRLHGTAEWNRAKGKYRGNNYPLIHGDDRPFDPSMWVRWPAVMFGADHYAARLPDGGTFHVWDKREDLGSNMLADAEMWWTSFPSGPTRIFRHKWLGYMRASEVGVHLHPTQKPLALLRYILTGDKVPPGTVLDPFMGSGSTLRAAKDLGRRAIGIEIEERYCEIAALRCAQEVMVFG